LEKIITYSFCDNFLDHLCDDIENQYLNKGKDISRLGIVFGGKRPAMFIKRALAQRLGRAFYPPQFFTIDDFVNYIIAKQEIFSPTQDLDNCYLLYRLAQQVTPQILEGRDSFARFLPWSREILAFLDQLDLENIPNDDLYSIQANAKIGYAVPEDINQLLKTMVTLREVYHKALRKDNLYTRGLRYTRAAELVDQFAFEEFDQILFCNFFYFHRSEEKIVKGLYQKDKAWLIFQGDERKWPVLKRISQRFSCVIQEGKEPLPPPFKLNLYAGFDGHTQVCQVREILKKIKDKTNTVIVLPASETVVPLLSEISTIIKEYNISMGYSLKRSSLYALFEIIFKAQISQKEERYYSKDYLKVLRHPFVRNLDLGSNPELTPHLIDMIGDILTGKEKMDISGRVFIHLKDIVRCKGLYHLTAKVLERKGIKITGKELQALLEHIHSLFFERWQEVKNFYEFSTCLEIFLEKIVQKTLLQNYRFNLNIAARVYDIKDELQNVSFNKKILPREDMFKIFEAKLSREMIAFSGSPLTGLQILGLLETRSLNFEHVIILDVNEGILPKLSIYEPLIPREVMITLNLDRLELEEEIQRYQFMRLISSAKNVHLIYQESKDKERSRFVEELIWEEQKKGVKENLERINLQDIVPVKQASFEVQVSNKIKRVKKTSQIVNFLKQHTYSASSINTYLRNPLDFYYSYVLGLREKDDLLDEPEARQIGTFIHEFLEEQFRPLLNKPFEIDTLFHHDFFNNFDKKFEDIFGQGMKSDAFLLKSVLKERLIRFLDKEQSKEARPIEKILYLEQCFEDSIIFPTAAIKFKYIVDRIDKMKDGTIMIIDYKTGALDVMPGKIDSIASMELSRESIRDQIRSFQIPLYFYYLDKQYKDQPINAATYNLRTLDIRSFIDKKNTHSRDYINAAFMRALDFIMNEILDPDVDFVEDVSGVY